MRRNLSSVVLQVLLALAALEMLPAMAHGQDLVDWTGTPRLPVAPARAISIPAEGARMELLAVLSNEPSDELRRAYQTDQGTPLPEAATVLTLEAVPGGALCIGTEVLLHRSGGGDRLEDYEVRISTAASMLLMDADDINRRAVLIVDSENGYLMKLTGSAFEELRIANWDSFEQSGVLEDLVVVEKRALAATAADFNDDSRTDFALISEVDGGTLSIYLADANGSYTRGESYSSWDRGDTPTAVASGDLNLDGTVDIAVGVGGVLGSGVDVFLNNGDGSFASPEKHRYEAAGACSTLLLADFTADGTLDAVVSGDDGLVILEGTRHEAGIFADPVGLPVTAAEPPLPDSMLALDANGDARLDLLSFSSASGGTQLRYGTGTTSFREAVQWGCPETEQVAAVLVADVHGDGAADVVSLTVHGRLAVCAVDPSGQSCCDASPLLVGGPLSMSAGDFRGNGEINLCMLQAVKTVNELNVSDAQYRLETVREMISMVHQRVLAANEAILLVEAAFSEDATACQVTEALLDDLHDVPSSVEAKDIDGDGRDDVVLLFENARTVAIGYGSAEMRSPLGDWATYRTGPAPSDLEIADYDQDGDLDLLVCNSGSHNLYIYLNEGDRRFAAHLTVAVGVDRPDEVEILDMDGDGSPDVLVMDGRRGSAEWFPLPAEIAAQASSPNTLPFLDAPEDDETANEGVLVAAGDFLRGDGSDLAFARMGMCNIQVLRNTGCGEFGAPETLESGPVSSLLLWDANQDGMDELHAISADGALHRLREEDSQLGLSPVAFGLAGRSLLGLQTTLSRISMAVASADTVIVHDASSPPIELRAGQATGEFLQVPSAMILCAGGAPVQPPRLVVSVATLDVNRDMYPDIAVLHDGDRDPSRLSVFLGVPGALPSFHRSVRLSASFDRMCDVQVSDTGERGLLLVSTVRNSGALVRVAMDGSLLVGEEKLLPVPAPSDVVSPSGSEWDFAVCGTSTALVEIGSEDDVGAFREVARLQEYLAVSPCSADFDTDGAQDLAVALPASKSIAVVSCARLQADSDVEGVPRMGRQIIQLEGTPVAIAPGDLNEDDVPDLIACLADGRDVVTLSGQGDLAFERAAVYSCTGVPVGARIADCNGDTLADIAIIERNPDCVRVILGVPDNERAAERTLELDSSPRGIVSADVIPGDGEDLIVWCLDGSVKILQCTESLGGSVTDDGSLTLEVLTLSGLNLQESYSLPECSAAGSESSDSVREALQAGDDVEWDNCALGTPFLASRAVRVAVLCPETGTLSVFETSGEGEPVLRSLYSVALGGRPSECFAIGDLDSNGEQDIAIAFPADNQVSIYWDFVPERAALRTTVKTGISPTHVSIGALGGGQGAFVAVLCQLNPHVELLVGWSENRRPLEPRRLPLPGLATALGVLDLDQDGTDDILLGSSVGQQLFALALDPTGLLRLRDTLSVPTARALGIAMTPRTSVAAVSAGDRYAALLVGEGCILVVRLAADGPLQAVFQWNDEQLAVSDVVFADVSNDGLVDLVVGYRSQRSILVFRGTASGFNAKPWVSIVSGEPRSMAAADLDADGSEDLLVLCSEGTLDVLWGESGTSYGLARIGQILLCAGVAQH